jgi:cytoskeleton protein RodZ
MQTLGERLEEARKRKGISIREAAEATKIRGDYLQKFEANSFELDLPPLYVRGFVRAYARHLDLDAARFLSEYDTLMAGEGRAPRRETRENFGRVEFGGEGETVETSTRAPAGLDPVLLKYAMLGGGALVLIVIILLIVNLFSGNSEPRTTAPKQAAAEQASAQPGTSAASAANTVQMLTLTALDQTRVKIVQDSDKAIIYEGALARGESRNFRKAGKLLITVEKGSNIRMEVNGRSYPVPLEGYGRFALD